MTEAMRKKLDEILNRNVVVNKKRVTKEELDDFEIKNGVRIPEEYREFLLDNTQVYVHSEYQFPMLETSAITPKSGYETIDFLYVGDFIENAETFIHEYGNILVPIGEASGDLLCIGLQGDAVGKIYYMYHEDENEDKDYYLVAESFSNFILSFEKTEEDDSIDLDDIEIELDDDLWND